MNDVLDPKQRAVADRVLDQESAARRHLVASLSGGHAYGFPSPDSDLDLKAPRARTTERARPLDFPRADLLAWPLASRRWGSASNRRASSTGPADDS